MKKIRLLVLALASLSVSIVNASDSQTIQEDFSVNPAANGWKIFGGTNLFHWNPANQNLEVTWDSSRPNSYFHLPLGTILSDSDDFSLGFDLRLNDIGPANSFEYSFAIGIGFINLEQAVQPAFLRGTGFNASNLVEFAYFRADVFADPATVYPTLVDKDGQFNYNPGGTDSTNYVLTPGDLYHVTMAYTASNQTLVTEVTNLSAASSARVSQPLGNTFSGTPFTDFRVNSISINSYSDAGQFENFEGSVLAHGTVDNFAVTVPPPPVQSMTGALSNGMWQVPFISRSNWLYTLERTLDFQSWAKVSPTTPGAAGTLTLSDTNAPVEEAFYRVRAERP